MKKFFTSPIGIIVSLGIVAGIIWIILYLSNSYSSAPDSFYGSSCSGVASIWRTKYYKNSGKYYSISECVSDNPNMCESLLAPIPSEISQQDFTTAYKQSKTPCNPLIA